MGNLTPSNLKNFGTAGVQDIYPLFNKPNPKVVKYKNK